MTDLHKPLLLIDVDGVLNCIVSNSVSKQRGLTRLRMREPATGESYTLHVDPTLAGPLNAMSQWFDLTWATTWQHAANSYRLRRVLALPELPVVTFVDLAQVRSKVPGVLRYASGRPFVWVDDDLSKADIDWLDAEHDATHLVIDVEEHQGLTVEHLAQAQAWAEAYAAQQSPAPSVAGQAPNAGFSHSRVAP